MRFLVYPSRVLCPSSPATCCIAKQQKTTLRIAGLFGIPVESRRQRVRCRNSASVFQAKVFICSCQSQPLHANCSSASVTTASSQAWPATIYCGTLAYKKCRIKRQYFLVYPPRVELGTGRVGGDYSIQLNYGYVPLYFIL